MKFLKVWRSLDPEQKRILRDKRVQVNRQIGPLIALFKPLAACDTVADAWRTRLGCSFALGIVLTIVLAFVFPIGAVALAALAAVAGYFYFWTLRIDLSNNLRQFVLPVLRVFREDIDPERPVHLRLDLSSPTAKEKKVSQSEPYKSGVYHKVVDTMYADPWMSAEAVLVDGTKLSWEIHDSIREQKKTKRNARGKYKTKTKYTKKSKLEVSVGMRKRTYDVTAAPEGAELIDGERRSVVRLERQVRTPSLDPVDPRALIDLVASVYRQAGPARKEA